MKRPHAVLLMSVTTFAGLTPILLQRDLQAQSLKLMAVSLGFGALFSTAVSLLLVPALCPVHDDAVTLRGRWRGRASPLAADGSRPGTECGGAVEDSLYGCRIAR